MTPSHSSQSDYVVDLAPLREDVALALGHTGGITSAAPCWKCGAGQPAHFCYPETKARERLLRFAGAEDQGNEPLRRRVERYVRDTQT